MKKTLLVLLVALISSTLFAGSSFAAEDASPTWDVTGGTSLLYQHTNANANGSHTWLLSGSGSYIVIPQFEMGLSLTWLNISNQGSSPVSQSAFTFLVLPTYDFSADIANSFFVQGGAGAAFTSLTLTAGATSETYAQFAWLVGVGRRVEIVKHLTWTPEVTWTGVKSVTDSLGFFQPTTTSFNIIPFQLSALF